VKGKEGTSCPKDQTFRNLRNEIKQALPQKHDENNPPIDVEHLPALTNQNKLKKYLYLEVNELKTLYHEYVFENKKLETKLKQIERDKQKVLRQITASRNNHTHTNSENKLTLDDDNDYKSVVDNPNELKQKIRERRDVYQEEYDLLEELKLKIKSDSLLLLSNQCIYQQKLLLSKKHMIGRYMSSKDNET